MGLPTVNEVAEQKMAAKMALLTPTDEYLWNKMVLKLRMLMALKLFVTLSDVLLPYFKDKHPDRNEEDQRF